MDPLIVFRRTAFIEHNHVIAKGGIVLEGTPLTCKLTAIVSSLEVKGVPDPLIPHQDKTKRPHILL